MENKEAAKELNKLITVCWDGVEGYKLAAGEAEGAGLKSLLNSYVAQRDGFATALQVEVVRLGSDPEEDGFLAGGLHRGWMSIKNSMTKRDDEAILAECETGEKAAVDAYGDALRHPDLPAHLRTVIERQHNQIMIGRNSMSQLHHQKTN